MRHRIWTKINVIVIIFFCLTAYSQSPESKNKINDQEKQEIEKFANEFTKNLELTFDLNQVSASFFAPGFKKYLSENETWYPQLDYRELTLKINDNTRFKNNVSMINFYNSLGAYASDYARHKSKNINDDDLVKKSLPGKIRKLFKRSRWLNSLLEEDNNHPEPKTLKDYRSFLAEVNLASEAMKTEIKKRKLKFPEDSEETDYYPGEKCKGERCIGLPEGTVIYSIHKYLMCLRIIKINNEFKIVNIASVIIED